jgi:tRNA (mo5U34)-methyltransferase
MQLDTMSRDELAALVPSVGWYHTIDFGDGLVSPGNVDHRPHLNAYGFPENMSGMTVLDVGRASGFFSFEFERRGAAVLSVELKSPTDKDWVGGEVVRGMRLERRGDKDVIHAAHGGRADFAIAARLLGSKVASLYCSVYELSPQVCGKTFDLVFAGSVLNHLANPMAALFAMRSVTRGTLVVANPYEPERRQGNPVARFVGRNAAALTTWWIPTIAAMTEMLHAAGFARVRLVSRNIRLRAGNGSVIPHFVLHADGAMTEADWAAVERSAPEGFRRFWPRRVAGSVLRKLRLRR